MRLSLMLMLIVVMAVPRAASAQGGFFDPLSCHPSLCAESEWLYDATTTDHTTVWRHDLRATPRAISIMFSPDPDQRRVYPLLWPWQWQTTGNPSGLEMGPRAVHLHIWSGAPMHGVWRPGEGWTTWSEGYWKIIVYR